MNSIKQTIVLTAAFLSLTAASAFAQRPIPPEGPDLFVEDADPGATGDFQVVSLSALTAPHCNPYTGEASGGGERKPANFFIYNRTTGKTLFVWTAIGATASGQPVVIFESYAETKLPAFTKWTAIDLEGDGFDDIIGHRETDGAILREFVRGPGRTCDF